MIVQSQERVRLYFKIYRFAAVFVQSEIRREKNLKKFSRRR